MNAPSYQPNSRQKRLDTATDALLDTIVDFIVYRIFRKKPAQLKFDVAPEQFEALKRACAPEWAELLEEREKAKKACDRRLLIGFITSLACAVISIVIFIGGGLFLAIIPLIISGLQAAKFKQDFNHHFAENLLPKILDHLDGFHYERHGIILLDSVRDSRILPPHQEDLTIQEDYLRTEIGAVAVEMVECQLSRMKTDAKGNTRKSTEFKGVILNMTLPKTFSSRVILQANWGKVLSFFQQKPMDKDQRITLDNNPFGKDFHIYAEDEAYAKQILTPDFLQNYKSFTDKLDVAATEMSLFGSQCVMLLHRPKDLFMAPNLHGDICEETVLYPMLQEIEMIEELTVIALEASGA
ncbi:DUF3137 domain-containing protein [Neptuniibacter sp. QD57_21]|uniref:DUF3137 domain-containing protein n=1 Tax=Neptuniibacter sp. QD57_21 TaxID=3398213 RepID=UPI0039F49282